jgi:hypothetical protein
MFTSEKPLRIIPSETVVSFDLEWTKNYRIPNGNQPFCFSFVYLALPVKLAAIEKLDFGFISQYVERKDEIPQLVAAANQIFGCLTQHRLTIIGHQLSSDLSVLLRYDPRLPLPNLVDLKQAWQNRRQLGDRALRVFDTRYDLESFLTGKSRRLVDVCVECQLEVTQPELKASMTKMQNDFYQTQDKRIMERLAVLNIRHSLSAALLYLYFRCQHRSTRIVNVNKIIHTNLRNHFNYVTENHFTDLFLPKPSE